MRKLLGVLAVCAAALTPAVSLAAPVHVSAIKYHNGPAILTSFRIPLFLTGNDMTTTDDHGHTVWVHNNGGNVPYNLTSTSASDFSEVNCVPVGEDNWCQLQDNLGDCMNEPTTGIYAFKMVPSSCTSPPTTPEEFLRISITGTSDFLEENRHTGDLVNCANLCRAGESIVGTPQPAGANWAFPPS